MTLKKYIGDKAFYKMVLSVALPIMLHNGITTFVGLLDNIMVGQIGTEQMSGVAIVNQLIFVFNLALFGIVSGAGIFSSQFYGKGDDEGVRQTFRFKWISCLMMMVLAIVIFITLKEPLIKLYLNDGSVEGDLELTLEYAKKYINILLLSFLPFVISQIYSGTLRETEHAVLPMVVGFIAVFVNCIGNYLLIFGKLGLPTLGVEGAAIATVISRYVEAAILIFAVWFQKKKYSFMDGAYKHFFHIEKELVFKIIKKGTPLFCNEFLWALGMAGLAQCYSVRGLAVVAGFNISSTVSNLFGISFMALGASVGIIVGKLLGSQKFEEAIDTDRKLIVFSVMTGLFFGLLLFFTAPLFSKIYNTTDEVRKLATNFMRVAGFGTIIHSFMNACYFTLRSGGKTFITFLYDSVFISCISFPFALLLVHFTTLPIILIYILVTALDLVKCVIGFVLLKKRVWLNLLV